MYVCVCVCITGSLCCTAETDRLLQINYNKKKFLRKKASCPSPTPVGLTLQLHQRLPVAFKYCVTRKLVCFPVKEELDRYELVNNRSLVGSRRLRICCRSEESVPAIKSLHKSRAGVQVSTGLERRNGSEKVLWLPQWSRAGEAGVCTHLSSLKLLVRFCHSARNEDAP